MSIPIALWAPAAAARAPDQRRLLLGLIGLYPLGYLGLMVAPREGAWVWASPVGAAAGVFPVVLTLIGAAQPTPSGTAALSGFTQGGGIRRVGRRTTRHGILYDATGGWTVPLLALTGWQR
jgi:CP family cyanate transporter-like MFS transporter